MPDLKHPHRFPTRIRSKFIRRNTKYLEAQAGEWVYLQFKVKPEAVSLKFEISGGEGDADLYVKQGDFPSPEDYDCCNWALGNDEACEFDGSRGPLAGVWYVGLYGREGFEDVTIKTTIYET